MDVQLVFHGSITLLIGLLCGAPMGRAINNKRTEEVIAAWRVAHSGLITGAILLFSVALILPIASMGKVYDLILGSGFILSTYGFVIALPLGAAIGERGLSASSGLGQVVYVGNMVGAAGALVGGCLLTIGAASGVFKQFAG